MAVTPMVAFLEVFDVLEPILGGKLKNGALMLVEIARTGKPFCRGTDNGPDQLGVVDVATDEGAHGDAGLDLYEFGVDSLLCVEARDPWRQRERGTPESWTRRRCGLFRLSGLEDQPER